MRNDVTSVLNARPIGARQMAIVFLVFLVLIIDGLDIQLLALLSPVIIAEWGTSKAAFGPAMAAALIGLSLGASTGGWLGDRFGRKTVLIGAALLFGFVTILASFARDVPEMALLRLVSGLGFGAATPNGIALASEWLPLRARAQVIGTLSIGTPFGGMIGALVALLALPVLGWRGCFIACGCATIVMAAAMTLLLPESTGFLLQRGRRARAEAIMRRVLGAPVHLAPPADMPEAGERRPSFSAIFARSNLRLNVGVWVGYYGLAFVTYAFAWTPLLLTNAGFTLPQALRSTFAFNLASVLAAALASLAVRRFGSRVVMLCCCILAFIGLALIALVLAGAHAHPTAATQLAMPALFALVGGAGGAATAIIYALLAFGYPLHCRASGVGFGLMVGRTGGITTTLLGGLLLSLYGGSPQPFMLTLMLMAVLAWIGGFVVDRHIPRWRREEQAALG